jgi:hypothetical protein
MGKMSRSIGKATVRAKSGRARKGNVRGASASRRIEEQSRNETTLQGWQRFWQLLSTIEKPNAALKRAARLHDEVVARGTAGRG